MLNFILMGTCVVYVGYKMLSIKSPTKNRELELKHYASEINFILENAKIYTERNERIENAYCTWVDEQPNYLIFGIFLPIGRNKKDLEKIQPSLENLFRKNVRILDSEHPYRIQVLTKELEKSYPYKKINIPNQEELYLVVGMGISGVVMINLNNNPHMLIAGVTGSGKSKLTQGIMCNLIENYTPNQVHIYLLDNKAVETPEWIGVPHVKKIAESVIEGCEIIRWLETELYYRLRLLKGERVKNILQYNKKTSLKCLTYLS